MAGIVVYADQRLLQQNQGIWFRATLRPAGIAGVQLFSELAHLKLLSHVVNG